MDIADISLVNIQNPNPTLNETEAKTGSAEELEKATEQFEAILIRQYLSEALKPVLEETMGSSATGSDMYQYMITDAMANQLSTEGTFGVASLLQMQLSTPKQELNDPQNTKLND